MKISSFLKMKSMTGVKYLFVGGMSALIELILFWVLLNAAGIPIVVANVVAVVCSTIFNFLMNRHFPFSNASNPVRSAVLYLLLFVFTTCFTSFCIAYLVDVLGIHALIAKLGTMACVVMWNYVLYKKVVCA